MNELSQYKYRGARAMVLLHEQQLRGFLGVWRKAAGSGLTLPKTSDPAYASMETLLYHVLRAARGYMVWMAEMLGLPDPEIREVPPKEELVAQLDTYVEHLLGCWRAPLANVEEDAFHKPEYASKWKVNYCIDAMLEHAVMHPIRHSFQLTELMGERVPGE